MFKPFALRILLALPLSILPAFSQGTTHLNVPAKQIVSITFSKGAGDSYGQFSAMSMQRADGVYMGSSVPAGQALIIRELSIASSYGTSANAFQVSVDLARVDSSGQFYYSDMRDSYTIPAGNYSFSYHFKSDVGMPIAGTFKPRVVVAPNNGPFPLSAWDNVSIQGWGYLTSF